jgi:hypothetical protein
MGTQRGTSGREVRTLTPLPMPPNCLLRDEIPLPDRYVPPYWAEEVVREWMAGDSLRKVGAYPTQSARWEWFPTWLLISGGGETGRQRGGG